MKRARTDVEREALRIAGRLYGPSWWDRRPRWQRVALVVASLAWFAPPPIVMFGRMVGWW